MSSMYRIEVGALRGELRAMRVEWYRKRTVPELTDWAYRGPEQKYRDAVDLARSAAAKWKESVRFGQPAYSLRQMQQLIAKDEQSEIVGLLVARSDLSEGVMAFALFHRTWNGNIYLDFLGANPNTRGLKLSGVGLWMLFELFSIAEEVNARLVWGETTKGSVGYYAKNVHTRKCDLLFIPKALRDAFSERMRGAAQISAEQGAHP